MCDQTVDIVKSRVMRIGRAYSSQNLDGLIIDLDYTLEQEGFCVIGQIKKSGETSIRV